MLPEGRDTEGSFGVERLIEKEKQGMTRCGAFFPLITYFFCPFVEKAREKTRREIISNITES
jgi:hypothetical protein